MAHPIVIELERKPKKKEVQIIKSPRWWPKSQNVRIYENGGYLKQEGVKALAERLKAAACVSGPIFDAFEGIIAETIREILREKPYSCGPESDEHTLARTKAAAAPSQILAS